MAVDEAVAARVDVGVVDLRRVADQHDLRTLADARDDRLHLVRRELLRLVEEYAAWHDELLGAPDEYEQLRVLAAVPGARKVGLQKNWPAGFAVAHVVNGYPHIQLIQITRDYTCVVDGKTFTA